MFKTKYHTRIDTIRGYDEKERLLIREGERKENIRNEDTASKLKHCPQCGQVWEDYPLPGSHNKAHRYEFYGTNFPTYGKPKEICPKCLEKN